MVIGMGHIRRIMGIWSSGLDLMMSLCGVKLMGLWWARKKLENNSDENEEDANDDDFEDLYEDMGLEEDDQDDEYDDYSDED